MPFARVPARGGLRAARDERRAARLGRRPASTARSTTCSRSRASCSRRRWSRRRRSPRRRRCSSRGSTACCRTSAASTRTTGVSASSCATRSSRTGRARATPSGRSATSAAAARSSGSIPTRGLALRVPHRPRVRQLGARGVAAALGRGAGGSVKVSVVGAGVMGLAAARAIAQRGHDVTVYEQFELKHKRGSSHGTSRIFRLSYDEEYWIRLAQRAYELWRELERESGTDAARARRPASTCSAIPQRAARGARRPPAFRVEELTPAQARERFGFAYDDVESPRLHARRRHLARGRGDRRVRRRRARGRSRDPRAHARRVARRRARRPRRRHGRRLGAEAARRGRRASSTRRRRARRSSTSRASRSRR